MFTTRSSTEYDDPYLKSEAFSTASDNQLSVEIHVFQGERSLALDNRTLGKFHWTVIPPAPSGVPQIEVTLTSMPTASSISGGIWAPAEQKITIASSSGLNKDGSRPRMMEAESTPKTTRSAGRKSDRSQRRQTIHGERFIKDSGDSSRPPISRP